jgi:hypothetical protein
MSILFSNAGEGRWRNPTTSYGTFEFAEKGYGVTIGAFAPHPAVVARGLRHHPVRTNSVLHESS